MIVLGLHWADLFTIGLYLGAMLLIGLRTARAVKGQSDLYLGGRRLGKFLQFFLNFGNMTDLNNAVTTTSAVYGSGAGGTWIALQTLFMTPYYWFMNVWFRRVRLVTMADLFEDRFGGRSLSILYSVFNIVVSVATIGWGYMVTYKTIAPLLGFAPWLRPLPFYAVCAAVVGVYCILGGLKAAVLVDIIQGLLIMVFSVMLIPFGLARLGGFHGLHERVPDYLFNVFGSVSAGEYTWYSMLAILFTSLVQINAVIHNMAIGGSARNEMAARLGAVGGGYGKRLMIVAWSFCGLIAIGLFGRDLPDPDNTWGVLGRTLLAPGLIGLMLVGILAAKMSALSAQSLVISALFARNLYEPARPALSERHYVWVGRLVIAAVLGIGVLAATLMSSVVEVAKLVLGAYAIFGAPIMLIFFWRRLTKAATLITVGVAGFVICILPYAVPLIPGLCRHPGLTAMTQTRMTVVSGHAKSADVAAGRAAFVGQPIVRHVLVPAVPIFFERIERVDAAGRPVGSVSGPDLGDSPANPSGFIPSAEGRGAFRAELWVLSLLGFDLKTFTPAGLLAARFWFDGLVPFCLLIPLSLLTRPTDPERVARFYAKMKTPVQTDPEQDARELAASYANPARFDREKLFPGTQWEFTRWNRVDTLGFLACCAVSCAILGLFWGLLQIGK